MNGRGKDKPLNSFSQSNRERGWGKEENASYRKFSLDGHFAIANEHLSSTRSKSP